MTTLEDVVKYIFHTPDNINPAILRQLLNDLIDCDGGRITPIPEALDNAGEDAVLFASNVYNKKGSNQTLTRENDEDVANNYYVAVAQNVTEDVRVRIGGALKSAEDIMSLSIGNNSFVEDVYYYVEDEKLFVAFPLLLFEKVEANDDIISNPSNIGQLTITGTKLVGTGEIIDKGNGFYTVNLEKKNGYIDFGLNMEKNEIALTKKIVNGHGASYGFVKADEQVDGIWGIGYVLFPWCTTEEQWNNLDDIRVTEYTIFVPSMNKAIELYLEGRKGSAIEDEVVIYDGGSVQQ